MSDPSTTTATIPQQQQQQEPVQPSSLEVTAPYGTIGDYAIRDRLGSGAFAAVYRGEHKFTREQVAVKIMTNATTQMSKRQQELLRREISYWQRLQHPNIVRMIGYSLKRERAIIVMEFLPGGTVGERLRYHPNKKFSERSVQQILYAVCAALSFCHENKVAHRDLKPDNILLDGNGGVKLSDFGLCNRQEDGTKIKTMLVGSPNWMAPEVFHGHYDAFPADMWAVGANAYQLLTGAIPFRASSERRLLEKILSLDYTIPEHVSPEARNFIQCLLVIDPIHRMTATACLSHPFLAPLHAAALATAAYHSARSSYQEGGATSSPQGSPNSSNLFAASQHFTQPNTQHAQFLQPFQDASFAVSSQAPSPLCSPKSTQFNAPPLAPHSQLALPVDPDPTTEDEPFGGVDSEPGTPRASRNPLSGAVVAKQQQHPPDGDDEGSPLALGPSKSGSGSSEQPEDSFGPESVVSLPAPTDDMVRIVERITSKCPPDSALTFQPDGSTDKNKIPTSSAAAQHQSGTANTTTRSPQNPSSSEVFQGRCVFPNNGVVVFRLQHEMKRLVVTRRRGTEKAFNLVCDLIVDALK